jgi:hypothetical protein
VEKSVHDGFATGTNGYNIHSRINISAARRSRNPGEAKTIVFNLCNGTADTPVYAVVPTYHVTPDNEAIISIPYGEILEIKGRE